MTTIRRALPIVGEEIVDVYYRMFDGLTMLSAENIVDTTNRLSEGELVVAMKYGVSHSKLRCHCSCDSNLNKMSIIIKLID